MNQESNPWGVPKPHPMAFSSTGSLPKKHRPALERKSLPLMATPETPSKKERSKFILPSNLSPFLYSPHQLASNDKIPPSSIRTKLSNSFNAHSEASFAEPPGGHYSPSIRSSSPIPHSRESRIDDVFGLMDCYSSGNEDSSSSSRAGYHNAMELEEHPNSSFLHALPWKSPAATFFTLESFIQREWPEGATLSSPPSSGGGGGGSGSVLPDYPALDPDYFESHFEIIDVLGSGSFSDVFRVRRKEDGHSFALKRSKQPFTGLVDRKKRLQEVENMWLCCDNPHCIQIISSWEQHGYLYILMELCDNGSLRDVIDYMTKTDARFTEYQVWQILHQIATGLEHIHRVEIAHLDIKPANIFINQEGVLKIGDFGLSLRIGGLHDPDAEGDKYYMAPETLEGHYDKPADIFSLGLLILELATDVELPSQGSSWQNLRHGDFSELSFEDVSDALNQLIKDMTDPDALKRPKIQEILRRVEAYSQRVKTPY